MSLPSHSDIKNPDKEKGDLRGGDPRGWEERCGEGSHPETRVGKNI